jgi:methionine-rich copper-binding protein CopC
MHPNMTDATIRSIAMICLVAVGTTAAACSAASPTPVAAAATVAASTVAASTVAAPPSQLWVGPPLLISEVLAHTDPPQQDSIELYNNSSAALNLGGWQLTDDNKLDPDKMFIIPDGTTLAAGGYQLFTEDDFANRFKLSEFGEQVSLWTPDGQLVDLLKFGVNENGISLNRHMTSDGRTLLWPASASTLGAPNAPLHVGPVVFTQIMYNPTAGAEYLAVTNISASPAPLFDPNAPGNTWRIDGVDFSFPANVTLASGETVYIGDGEPASLRTELNLAPAIRIFGPWRGGLAGNGERIALQKPQPPETSGAVAFADVDVVEYNDKAPWPSAGNGRWLSRRAPTGFGDDPAEWQSAETFVLTSVALLPFVVR